VLRSPPQPRPKMEQYQAWIEKQDPRKLCITPDETLPKPLHILPQQHKNTPSRQPYLVSISNTTTLIFNSILLLIYYVNLIKNQPREKKAKM